jgi:hypothetical protein
MEPLKPGLLALLLLLPVVVMSAAPTPTPTPTRPNRGAPDQELDEVLVTGQRARVKRVRDPKGLAAWLNRLRGDFTYEGEVELGGEDAPGDRQAASGVGRCSAYGPAVNCMVQVTWTEMRGSNGEDLPGGVSTLTPAVSIYAVDLNFLAIQSLQVDSRGRADSGLGYLAGDTLTTITPCVELPGDCRRISRIEAQSDGKLIRMQIDIEQDEQRVVRYSFVLRRQESARR